MPRLTLRMQLTLLYAVPFALSGALLLTIPIANTRVSQPADQYPGITPTPADPSDDALHRMIVFSALGLIVMTLVSLVLGYFVASRFLRPLRTINATAREISATNLHRRLDPTRRDDEFSDLTRTLNALFARLEAAFESQRRFVANASHELRTPLTAERALLQVALADPSALETTRAELLELNRTQERLIESLLTLAGSEQGIRTRERFELSAVVGEVLASRRDPRLTATLRPAPAAGDPELVRILVANLVDNALRHNTSDGTADVITSTVDGQAAVTVLNTGPVVPPERLEQLFQPFERLGGRSADSGHGLGLAIVRAIVEAHGATLIPYARPEGGLQIEIRFRP